MGQKIKVKNGPDEIEFQEFIIGSEIRIALHLEQETAPNSLVFVDMDLTTKGYVCHVKDAPRSDVLPDFQLVMTPRVSEPGWVDLLLDGTATINMLERTYYASVKVWPIGQPEFGITMAVMNLPMVYRATR